MKLRYRADVDGLRAVAVLAVVGFHAFPDWMRGGFVGVDIFFVISGFLISTILLDAMQRGTFSFADFYARRIRRIFPALSVILLAVLVFGGVALQPEEYAQLGTHVLAGAAFVVNFVLWGETGYFDGPADTKPLLHLWSLGVEEQFYIIWPLVLWFSGKAGVNRLLPIAGIGTASFVANVLSVPRDAFYFPHTRFWELMIGSALAYAVVHSPPLPRSSSTLDNTMSLAGIALIAASLALINQATEFPGWWALLPTAGAALLIQGGEQAWFNRVILSWRPLVWIGLISYPLYLWHWPLLTYARILVNPEGSSAIDPSRNLRAGLVLMSFALAWLTYRLIEQPIRTGSRIGVKATGLVAVMLLAGVMGWSVYAGGGFPRRIQSARQRHPEPAQMTVANYRSHPSFATLFTGVPPIPGRDLFLTQPSSAEHFAIAVIGDSHAWVLYDGLSRSTNRSIAGIGRGTCAPLFNVDAVRRTAGVETPLHCQPLIDNALEHFSREAATEVIVLTAFYAQYERDIRLTQSGQTQVTFHDALRDTLTRLARTGKPLIFAYDVPEIPRACYRRQFPVWNQQPHGECTVPRSLYEANRRNIADVVREVAGAFPNVTAYDPGAVLCNEQRCGEIDEQHHLYLSDGNHVNTFGGQRLGADVARFIERLLDSR